MAIIGFILVLLNTYPVYVSQTFVHQSKQNAMGAQAAIMASALAGLDELSPVSVGRCMAVLDDRGSYRVIVTNEAGLILYDNAVSNVSTGQMAMQNEIVRALSGRDVFRSRLIDNAFESRLTVPVMSQGHIAGSVYLYDYDTTQASMLTLLQSNLSTFTVVVLAFVVILSIFVSLALTRRVTGLMRAIIAVRDGDYGKKAPVRGKDELALVAAQFNELSDILQKTERLRQQFVSDASHELKTPLASIRLLTDSILQTGDMDLATIREFTADIGHEIDRLGRMTEKLMHLSRLDSGPDAFSGPLNPAQVIRRVVRMLTPLAEASGISLRSELSDRCVIRGSEDDLYQVVFNLVENAIKYNRPGGAVRVLCFTWDVYVQITVDDTGVGIPEEDLPRVFDRFYRVDKARSREAGGAGLGLSIVSQTIRNMGGTVELESVHGKGTRFTVQFPVEVTADET